MHADLAMAMIHTMRHSMRGWKQALDLCGMCSMGVGRRGVCGGPSPKVCPDFHACGKSLLLETRG